MSSSLESLPWMAALTEQVLDLWSNKALHHSLCLHGHAGIGKQHQCHFLAATLLCEQSDQQPCGQCRHCIVLNNAEHPDFLSFGSTDIGGKIGIEQVRSMTEFTTSTASMAPMKIVVIAQLEHMTLAAANAVLKLLEEPPPNVYFLLTCSKVSQLMPTIRSRLEFFSIASPAVHDFKAWVKEYTIKHDIVLTPTVSQNRLDHSYQLAQQGPLQALDYLLITCSVSLEQLPGIPSFKRHKKSVDLLQEFDRFLEVMTQSSSAIRMHLSVLLRTLSIEQSLLFYELWMSDQLNHLKKVAHFSNGSRALAQIKILWAGFNAMQATRESLVRSPQLNVAYLQKNLLDQWMLTIHALMADVCEA